MKHKTKHLRFNPVAGLYGGAYNDIFNWVSLFVLGVFLFIAITLWFSFGAFS